MANGPEPERGGATGTSSALRTLVDVLAFGCELAMLVVLGIAGWALDAGGLISIAFMIFYPALAVLIWSLWMAPRSARRLRDPLRLTCQVVLFAATAVLAAVSGHVVLGVVFAVVASAVFGATRLTGASADT